MRPAQCERSACSFVWGERSNVRAAEQLRMTFLHGEMALAYARDHLVPEKRGATKSQCLREPCNEVCVTWPEAIGMGASGYTVGQGVVDAYDCGLPQRRPRLFIVAHAAAEPPRVTTPSPKRPATLADILDADCDATSPDHAGFSTD